MKKHLRKICVLVMAMSLMITSCGIGNSAQTNAGDTQGTQEQETQNREENDLKETRDLSRAFSIILENGTREFFEGYPIDEAFLYWVKAYCGEDAILDIAYHLYEGNADVNEWYQITGESMHVLWLRYCEEKQYATYYLENVHWLDCAEDDKIVIDFTGDINLADEWYTMQVAAEKENGILDCIDTAITEELQNADLSVINNEFVFTDGGDRQTNKAYTFGAKTENVSMLEVFGADLANLANNHTYDYRASGLMDTIATLEGAGIATMGAGENLEAAKAIQYYVANGKKIAVVAATQIERFTHYTKEATATEAGVLKTLDPTIYNEVIALAEENSDYVIANVHWGVEGTYQFTSTEHGLAEGFVEAGADAVIGGHPHRVQGVEFIDDVPIVYSMGNFWFSTGTLYTMVVQLQINETGEIDLRMIPCIQKDLTTTMLSEEEQDDFFKFMADISKSIVIDKDGFIYNTQNGKNRDLLDGENYQSGKNYGSHNPGKDLEGRTIDIVGNLQ